AELGVRLARVAEQGFDFGGPEIARIDTHYHVAGDKVARGTVRLHLFDNADFVDALAFPAQLDPKLPCSRVHELAHAVLNAGGNQKIFGLSLLQHQPLHFDVVPRMPPVPQRIQITEVQAVLQSQLDTRHGAGDLAGNKSFSALRRLVIKE